MHSSNVWLGNDVLSEPIYDIQMVDKIPDGDKIPDEGKLIFA
jgi:hypothetical protein